MDMEKATPQMISDYKQQWMKNSHPVRLHSDLDVKGKDWCRKNLDRWQWSMKTWTDVYEHTFHFEDIEDAKAFINAMPMKFVNQEKVDSWDNWKPNKDLV